MIENQFKEQALSPGFIRRTDEVGTLSHDTKEKINAALLDLQTKKDVWVKLDVGERISILDKMLEDVAAIADEWVFVSVKAKGISGDTYAESEEWAMFAMVLRNIRLLGQSLHEIQDHGRPSIPGQLSTSSDGQHVAHVFPHSFFDRFLLPGTTAEVWMQPGLTVEEIYNSQARFYRSSMTRGKVVLVLGAGNASMLVVSDILYKLFVEGQVVILKFNPVNAYLGPVLERGFRTLISSGFLRIVYGGVAEGLYLCNHPAVDEIHTTGSDKTYETIVFGSGIEGAKRKAERKPLIDKRFTGELGNVTPVIILPGKWSDDDIAAQGEKLVTWLVINSGFNCLTPRVIVQWANWNQREALNEAVSNVLTQVNTRKAYYPGAKQRLAQFLAAHPKANQYGSTVHDHLPWTFITEVDPNNSEDICFRNEAFCGLMAETALEANNVQDYLEQAVRFANETLWGNLTATIVVHPDSLEDREVATSVDRAVADLRYGMVLINQFAGLGFFAMTTTWGAFPGNDIYDIQSGIGVTSNVLMFEYPQKSVVRSPFTLSPDPFTLSSRNPCEFAKKMVDFQYKPSLWKIPGYFWSALRS